MKLSRSIRTLAYTLTLLHQTPGQLLFQVLFRQGLGSLPAFFELPTLMDTVGELD
jgi:hypothetical protein